MIKAQKVYTFQTEAEQQHAVSIGVVAWSPDGKYIVTSSNRTSVGANRELETGYAVLYVWNARTGEIISNYRGHAAAIIAAAWSPDGTCIASGGWDHTVQVWEAMTGKPLVTYSGHSNIVCDVAWSPDGLLLASSGSDLLFGSRDKHVAQHIWNAMTGKGVVTYTGHLDTIFTIAWSPDGNRIVSGGLTIWCRYGKLQPVITFQPILVMPIASMP
jgi:WD40 repeat protein